MSQIQLYDNIGCEFFLSETNNYFVIGSALKGYNTLKDIHVGSYIPYLVRNISSSEISWEIGTGLVDKIDNKIVVRDRTIIESHGSLVSEGRKNFYIFAHADNYNNAFNNIIVKNNDFNVEKIKCTYLVDTGSLVHATLPRASECQSLEIQFKIIGNNENSKLDIRDNNKFHEIIKGQDSYIRIGSDGKDWLIIHKTAINTDNTLKTLSNEFSAMADPAGEDNSFQYKDGTSFAGANVFWGANNKALFGSSTTESSAKNIIPTSGEYDFVINNTQDKSDFIVHGSGLPSGYLPKNLIFTYDGKLGLNLPSGTKPQTALHIINNSCRESIRIENLSSCPTHIPNITLYHKPQTIDNNTVITKVVSSSKDSNNNKTDYVSINSTAKSITANNTKGKLEILVASGNNNLAVLSADPDETILGDVNQYHLYRSATSGIKLYNAVSSGVIGLMSNNNIDIHNDTNISISGNNLSIIGTANIDLSSNSLDINGTTNINQALIISSGGNVAFPLLQQNQILAVNNSGFLAPATGFSFGGIGPNRFLGTDQDGVVYGPFPTNAFLPTYDDFIWTKYPSRATYVSQRQLSFIEPVPIEEFSVGDQIVITTGTGSDLTSLYRNITETIIIDNAISGVLVDQNMGDATLCNVIGDCTSVTKGGVLTIQASVATEEIASEATATVISTRPNTDTIFNTLQKDINFKVFGIEPEPAINVMARASLTPLQSGEYFEYATQFKDFLGDQISPFIIPISNIGEGASNTNNSAVFGNPAWSGKVSTVGSNGRASHYGTYDQNGNVFEWVSEPSSYVQNVCGGSWRTLSPEHLRMVIPTPYNMSFDDVGFRICSRYGFYESSAQISSLELSFSPIANIENISDNTPVLTEDYTNRTGLQIDPEETTFTNLGRVLQPYQISRYQITNAQYTAFLNAVNKLDSFTLYNTNMSSSDVGGIIRTGSNGSYVYTTKTNMEDKPVVFVDYLSAIRFTNWLHNGAPTEQDFDISDIESGAYEIIVGQSSVNVITNKYQKYWIPTLNEWHKAAYFRPIVNLVSGDRSAVLIRASEPYEISSGNLASLTVRDTTYTDQIIVGNINETQGSLLLAQDQENISGIVNISHGYSDYLVNIGAPESIVIESESEEWAGSFSSFISNTGIQLATSGSIRFISPELIVASGLSIDDIYIKNLNFLNEDGDLVPGGLYPGPNGGFIFKNLNNENVSSSDILSTVSLDSTVGVALSTASFLQPVYVNNQGVLAGYGPMQLGTAVEGIQGDCVQIGGNDNEENSSSNITLVTDAIRIGPAIDSFRGSILVHNGEGSAVWRPGDFLRSDGMTWNRYSRRAVEIMNNSTLRFSNLEETAGGTGPVDSNTILAEFGIEDTIAIYNQNRDVVYAKLADIVLLGETGDEEFFNNINALEIVICPPLSDTFIEGSRLEIPGGGTIDLGYAFSVFKGAYLNMSIEPGAVDRFSCAGLSETATNGFKPSTINTISIRPTIDTIFNKVAEDINFTIYGSVKTLNNRYEPDLFDLDDRGMPNGLIPAFHVESYLDNSFKGSVTSGVFNTNSRIIASGIIPDENAKITINTKTPYVVTSLPGVVNGFIFPDNIRPTGEFVTTSSDISTYADLTVNGYTYSKGIISTEIVLRSDANITYIPNAPLTVNSLGQIVSIVPPEPPTIPGPPSSVAGFAANSSVRLYWTKPADDGNAPIINYIVEYSDNNTDWILYEHDILTDDEIVVDGLENGVAYRFRVSAINSVGSSSASDPSEEIRPTSNAPSKPINLTIISRTSSTIVLDWASPSYIGPVGSTLQDYIVDYAEATDPPGSLSWQSINTEGVSDITISNISEELTYYIRVRAINNLAQGAYASIKSIGSNDEPQPPEPEEDPSETWDFGIVQFTGVCI